jgi:hypothetical protein
MKVAMRIVVWGALVTAVALFGGCPANDLLADVQQKVDAAKVSGTVATPVFSPTGDTFSSDQSVSISCSTSGATIHCTIDGSTPTEQSPAYSAPIAVTGNGTHETIKAIAVAANMHPSSIAIASYTISYGQVATPVFIPAAGYLPTGNSSITITDSTPGATVYYTIDGSTPSTNSTQYAVPFSVNGTNGATLTIKAIAVAGNMIQSIATAAYTFRSDPQSLLSVIVSPSLSEGKVNQWTANPAVVSVISGTPCALTATPSSGWGFVNWTVQAGIASFADASAANTTVTLTSDATIQANFAQYSLTVNSGGNGTTKPSSLSMVGYGDPVSITATEATGCQFVNWTVSTGSVTFGSTGTGTSTTSSDTVTLTSGNAAIQANFTPIQYALTISASPTAGGTVSSASMPATSSGLMTAYYSQATPVITATPNTGFDFVNWTAPTGGVSFGNANSASTTVTLTSAQDEIIQANFARYTVTYDGNGDTGGSVPIDSNYYLRGNTVTVQGNTGNIVKTAYYFAGWNTAADGTGTTYTQGGNFSMGTANVTLYAVWNPSGSTWTARTLPRSATWTSVTYGNGVFVAVATNSNAAATSPDGINWTARTLPSSASWSSVTYGNAYGNGIFVAVAGGPSTKAATSPDGIIWTARTLPSSASWRSVSYGNGVFVAIAGGATTVAASSTDGMNWTARTLPSSANWYSVTYGNGVFVAVTNSNAAATSPDGMNWTARTFPVSASWYSVTYGNGVFVAVAFSSVAAATSPDGIIWTLRTSLPFNAGWQSVTYGNGVFVAIDWSSTAAATSPDGITWTSRTLPSYAGWSSVTYGNGVFVTVADGPSTIAATSP